MRGSTSPFAWAGAAVALALWTSAPAPLSAQAEIDQILERPPADQMHFGVLAVDRSTGAVLYEHNARRRFVPASNQKLLVTATAMSLFGSSWRYETAFTTRAPLEDGTLDGDLMLIAGGDPSLSDRYWESGEAALRALADSLRAAGVERVRGALVVDVSAWDSASVGPTWEVEDLRFRYGATGGAFAIDEGEVELSVRSGDAPGDPVQYSWRPVGTDGFVESRLSTAPPDSSTRIVPFYLPESRRLVMQGRVPAGTSTRRSYAMRDPVRQATVALLRALSGAGIVVEGGWRIVWEQSPRACDGTACGLDGGCGARACADASCDGGRTCAGYRRGSCEGGEPCPDVREERCDVGEPCPDVRRLAGLYSPPLSELVRGILETSQNWMAEQLVRTLGAELGDEGSWEGGMRVVEDFLTKVIGVDSMDVAPRDGSGLSAYNLVTPRALVRVLSFMADGPHAGAFRSALAAPGEEDSTLEHRLLDLEGRVFAKTGTISNVNSLSGYLVRSDGSDVVFSILSNGSGTGSAPVRAAIDDIVRALAR